MQRRSDFGVLIADDEPAARRGVRQLLGAFPEFAVVGECRNGAELLAALDRVKADAVFLDIQMPGVDGFEVIRRRTPERMPAVVFLTAYDQFAIRAFEAQGGTVIADIEPGEYDDHSRKLDAPLLGTVATIAPDDAAQLGALLAKAGIAPAVALGSAVRMFRNGKVEILALQREAAESEAAPAAPVTVPLPHAAFLYDLRFDGVGIGVRKELVWVVERILRAPFRAAKMVDQLIARDRMHPGRERPGGVVCRSSRVHGDQSFLQQVFGVGRATRSKAPQIVGAQMAVQAPQQS